MALTFTDWENYTDDDGNAKTIDWTSAATLRGHPPRAIMEALCQAAWERYFVASHDVNSYYGHVFYPAMSFVSPVRVIFNADTADFVSYVWRWHGRMFIVNNALYGVENKAYSSYAAAGDALPMVPNTWLLIKQEAGTWALMFLTYRDDTGFANGVSFNNGMPTFSGPRWECAAETGTFTAVDGASGSYYVPAAVQSWMDPLQEADGDAAFMLPAHPSSDRNCGAWFDQVMTAMIPEFVKHTSGSPAGTFDGLAAPPRWTVALLLSALGQPRAAQGAGLFTTWAKQQYDMLNLLRWHCWWNAYEEHYHEPGIVTHISYDGTPSYEAPPASFLPFNGPNVGYGSPSGYWATNLNNVTDITFSRPLACAVDMYFSLSDNWLGSWYPVAGNVLHLASSHVAGTSDTFDSYGYVGGNWCHRIRWWPVRKLNCAGGFVFH